MARGSFYRGERESREHFIDRMRHKIDQGHAVAYAAAIALENYEPERARPMRQHAAAIGEALTAWDISEEGGA